MKYAVRDEEGWSISVVARNIFAIDQISLAIDNVDGPHIVFVDNVRLVCATGKEVKGNLHLPLMVSD